MNTWSNFLLVLLLVTDLVLLGASRMRIFIRVVAMQGILLGLLPILRYTGEPAPTILFLAGVGIGLKGLAFPWLLRRAVRETDVAHEARPFIGYSLSILIGLAALALSLVLGAGLPLKGEAISSLTIPAAFTTIFTGFFLIAARRSALTQVLGYMVLENGVYSFGIAVVAEAPLIVELGVLLDLFVAVFIMGIVIFHINRVFDHTNVDELSSLKDWRL